MFSEMTFVPASDLERKKEDVPLERALELRSIIQSELASSVLPDRSFIQRCREIIVVLREVPVIENVNRSQRFSKSAKDKLIQKFTSCVACGGGTKGGGRQSAPFEVHHIIPREHGGDESFDNGLLLCRKCHVEVHD